MTADRTLAWEPGERADWAATPLRDLHNDRTLAQSLRMLEAGEFQHEFELAWLFAQAPEEAVRARVRAWRPEFWQLTDSLKPVVARFGLDAWDMAVHAAEWNWRENGAILLPFLSADVARLMARLARRAPTARELTGAWLRRHGLAAVPFLVPALDGAPGIRRDAEHALCRIAASAGPGPVAEAARYHGAAGAVARLLADGPSKPPPGPPPYPVWADPATLPRVRLRAGGELPLPEVRALVLLLARTKRPGDHPGSAARLDAVLRRCDPADVAELGWELFVRWRDAGTPSTHNWALPVLARTGDDETARRLAAWVRACPGWAAFARAAVGLETLAAFGDRALPHIAAIARSAPYKLLRERAGEVLGEAARAAGLTPERLADRFVPDFGLDPSGTLTLDYGPRRFLIGFDERLAPHVRDERGRRRAALPKPGVRDDPARAFEAWARFAALRKDARMVAAERVHRLETAMVTGERWPLREFRAHFADHPLVWHIARRLVWTAEHDGTVTPFRIAEDRGLADASDGAFAPPPSATVGVAHPLLLDGLETWSELFADYEILQPFPQLARAVHTLSPRERAADRLPAFEDLTVPFGAALALTRRGWDRGAFDDTGVADTLVRDAGGGRRVVLTLDPGFLPGRADASPTQRVVHIHLLSATGTRLPFGALDPVAASELLADLSALTG
ncbi:DUF4132 domain-containing protein [Actinomadura terrae]|uniref:DUF4132 domain-containing protein n=1 Tax=Actinomadura terrae TaxID=604353 RepID=UPI001FA7E5DD|nr:DUF4132 domain-containing protein [Actinomadura terrae]